MSGNWTIVSSKDGTAASKTGKFANQHNMTEMKLEAPMYFPRLLQWSLLASVNGSARSFKVALIGYY